MRQNALAPLGRRRGMISSLFEHGRGICESRRVIVLSKVHAAGRLGGRLEDALNVVNRIPLLLVSFLQPL